MVTAQLQCATELCPAAICGCTDAAQGLAHRWWITGMEGGCKPPGSLSCQSICLEVHRQNVAQQSLLADEICCPLRLTVQFDHTRIQSLYQVSVDRWATYLLVLHPTFQLPSTLGQTASLGIILWPDSTQATRGHSVCTAGWKPAQTENHSWLA